MSPDRQQHQLSVSVLGDRTHSRQGERLVEGLGMNMMELPDTNAHLGDRPFSGPALDGVDDGSTQTEFVHG